MEDDYYDAREINGLSELTIPEYARTRMQIQPHMQLNKQPQPQPLQNALLTTHNLPKSSFRGNIKYSQNNGNSNSDNNNNNNNYQYKSNSNNNKNKNNIGYNVLNQSGRNLNSRNNSNHSSSNSRHNNNLQGKHNKNKSAATNANNLDNDELKDYKSKIKNKYNIDYDHSLDEEYEIIEAIE